MSDVMRIGAATATELEQRFQDYLNGLASGERLLELGTRRWESDRPTHHAEWVPAGVEHVMSDVMAGQDVDVVADAHHLVEVFGPSSFEAVLAVSVWEHLRQPWVAAEELWHVLKPDGLALVVTHQTFPLHGYPYDYFRFSTEAMTEAIFPPPLWDSKASYQYPCQIIPPSEVTRWNPHAESFLNIAVLARKNR